MSFEKYHNRIKTPIPNIYIIGVAGKLNSGKDTVAAMINYIKSVGTTSAKFKEYIELQDAINVNNRCIIHFSDNLKDCISIMFNIERKYLDCRDHKDNFWYDIIGRRFITEYDSESNKYIKLLVDNTFYNKFKNYTDKTNDKVPIIKIRELLQYFGTELCRNNLYDNVWVNSTMAKASNIADTFGRCIIPDVRFSNEANAIRNISKGRLILVTRDSNNSNNSNNHSSENIDFNCDIIINNNGTKMELFYKVLKYMQQL